MPLFISVSGVVFKIGCDNGKYKEFMPFVLNKFRRLMIPFVVSAVVLVAPTLACCGGSELGYVGTVIDIFKGGPSMKHLWFLPALFWMFVMIWGAARIRINFGIVFIMALVASIASNYIPVHFPILGLGNAIQKFPFFVLGMTVVSGKWMKLREAAIFTYIALCVLSECVIKWCPCLIVKDVAGIVLSASSVCCCFCLCI